jgi:hypothetical protein
MSPPAGTGSEFPKSGPIEARPRPTRVFIFFGKFHPALVLLTSDVRRANGPLAFEGRNLLAKGRLEALARVNCATRWRFRRPEVQVVHRTSPTRRRPSLGHSIFQTGWELQARLARAHRPLQTLGCKLQAEYEMGGAWQSWSGGHSPTVAHEL